MSNRQSSIFSIKDMTIGGKLALGFGLVLLIMVGLGVFNYIQLNKLHVLELDMSQRQVDAQASEEVKSVGAHAYMVVAYSVINRNLKASAVEWREIKTELLEDIAKVKKIADHESRRRYCNKKCLNKGRRGGRHYCNKKRLNTLARDSGDTQTFGNGSS